MLAHRAHAIEKRLRDWTDRVPDLRGLALADRSGLPLVSTLASPRLEERLAALAGTVLSQMEWVGGELGTGPVYAWRLSGRDRQLFVAPLTGDVVLAAMTDSIVNSSAIELALLAVSREIFSLVYSETEIRE